MSVFYYIFRYFERYSLRRGPMLALAAFLSFSGHAQAATPVPDNANIPPLIEQGNYDLELEGDARWNTVIGIGSNAGRAGISIEGNGGTITVGGAERLFDAFDYNGTMFLSLTNIIFTSTASHSRVALIGVIGGRPVGMNLDGTIFENFYNTYGSQGSIIHVGGGSGTSLTVDGSVIFRNNTSTNDGTTVEVRNNARLNFTGDVLFEGNQTGNYGGAINVYAEGATINFQGDATFRGNHTQNFGGAIDVYGGTAAAIFDGTTLFDSNYSLWTSDTTIPHISDQHPRGGALNIGYIDASGTGPNVTFNGDVTFTNNFVASTGTTTSNRNAYGGAIAVWGNGTTYKNYNLFFNQAAIFDGNRAFSVNGSAYGGAIYYRSSVNSLAFQGGTQFTNNYAGTLGGGIFFDTNSAGTITLNAIDGDILFQGNRHGADFNAGDYTPVDGSGTPNAIYFANSGHTLQLNAADGNVIEFYDPVAAVAGATLNVNKAGEGEAILYGDGTVNPDYDWNVNLNTNVTGGTLTLADGITYGATNSGTTAVGTGGTLRGNNDATINTSALTVQNGGTLGVNGGNFTVTSPSITMQDGSTISGFGTLNATSDINITGTVTGAVSDTVDEDELAINRALAGSGGITKTGNGTLIYNVVNSYTGATLISGGTLTAAIANAFAQSGSVTVDTDGTLAIGDFNQLANNLSGSGTIDLGTGSAELTANQSTAQTFSGLITGSGKLIKDGSADFTITGTNDYTGGTDIESGNLIITNGQALGTGLVTSESGTILRMNIGSGEETFANQLQLSGDLEKTGAGSMTLTAQSSSAVNVDVQEGRLSIADSDIFYATNWTTQNGATTGVGEDARIVLTGAYRQLAGGTLNVAVGDPALPEITAATAALAGTLNVSGVNGVVVGKASELSSVRDTVISTTGGITGDFDTLIFAESSPVDYLSYNGYLDGLLAGTYYTYTVGFGLTWYAGTTLGNGTYTLEDADDVFEVDVELEDQAPSGTGWDGTSLTKAGEGTLILSAENSYTGTTTVEEGTLAFGIENSIATSSVVTVEDGAVLSFNDYDQIINNLSGAGEVALGSAQTTAANDTDTGFSGEISGTGSVDKTGTGTLTLSGENTYSGGTTVSEGTLRATVGGALGTGEVAIDTGGTLDLAIASGNETFSNVINGAGALEKTGAGTATLIGGGAMTGNVNVNAGTLALGQTGAFSAGNWTTADNATTTIGSASQLALSGIFTQSALAVLNVAAGDSNEPAVTADTAFVDGTLNVTGLNIEAAAKASELINNMFVVIAAAGGITGEFDTVNLGGATSTLDYLTYGGFFNDDRTEYSVGLGLTWFAGSTFGNGTFTLDNTDDVFEVDVELADEASSGTGWDGTSLTKAGEGTLILSAENSYTGSTLIEEGTLILGIEDAIATSSDVTVEDGALLSFNDYNQTINNLSGAGDVDLGSAQMTAANDTDTEFSGTLTGTGSLEKTGTGTLTLSGTNDHSGGTTISEGRLQATVGGALGTGDVDIDTDGTLDLAIASGNQTFTGAISGAGELEKTGAGTATLTGGGIMTGNVNVNAGTLALGQAGAFSAGNWTTADNATTTIGSASQLALSGIFSQGALAVLNIAVGDANEPAITAGTAVLEGALNVTGLTMQDVTKASELADSRFVVVSTTNGISNEFASVNLGGAASTLDYLTFGGFFNDDRTEYSVGLGLTWYAGATNGNGTFTLDDADDVFEVDVELADQNASGTGWDGTSLTKAGEGTLILSAVNSYTGTTTVEEGTLSLGIEDSIATSSAVTVEDGALLSFNDYNQTINNLSGAGEVALGGAQMTAANDTDTEFFGEISGTGNVDKTGTGTLTLSGENTYSGGTTITDGTLQATVGGALGTGDVDINTSGTLDLAIASGTATFGNSISGAGELEKTGAGTATLTGGGTMTGNVTVDEGTLALAQTGSFTANGWTTDANATTAIGANAQLILTGNYSQDDAGILSVTVGTTNEPAITAAAAAIGGTLNITGYDPELTAKASELIANRYTVISTTGGITGNFDTVTLGGATSPVDYLTLGGFLSDDLNEYSVGFGLTWYAGTTDGNGTFTIAPGETFEVDVELEDESASGTGWDGTTLTKAGEGTLILSAVNSYTGSTLIEEGTLVLGIEDAIATSSDVTVEDGALLSFNDYNQTINNLSGAGEVDLGNAIMTAANDTDTEFSGSISGTGSLDKTGTGTLSLSGTSDYSGGTTISEGTLAATVGGALGTGEVDIDTGGTLDLPLASGNETFVNELSGAGELEKTGAGTATLTGGGTMTGNVTVDEGTLALGQAGAFGAGNWTTTGGATTAIAAASQLALTGTYSQAGTGILSVTVGALNEPAITAATAAIGGTLNIAGFDTTLTTRASDLIANRYTVISTTGGINGNFDTVSLGGETSPVDYLTLGGFLSDDLNEYSVGFGLTWYAGTTDGNGLFTIGTGETFEVDVELEDESASGTGWDGTSLTKAGEGTLILSAVNSYTGTTTVDEGELALGIADAIATSSGVTVEDGALLSFNDYNQTINNLSGAGEVDLGNAIMTAANDTDTEFSGSISGTGSIDKIGTGTLTLSGTSDYSGGTTITEGTLAATVGGALGTGEVDIDTGGTLDLAIASGSETFGNAITGAGELEKTGAGTATLTGGGTMTGNVTVTDGTLALGQTGAFAADNWTTDADATTSIAANSQLVLTGEYAQDDNGTLSVTIGASNEPAITAAEAAIGGTLNITGYDPELTAKASELLANRYTVISTTNGITGEFDDVTLGGATSPVDYLTLGGFFNDDRDEFSVGFGLTWYAGITDGNGTFTLGAGETFEVDVELEDESASGTGWDGESLTKAGEGMLILSAVNSYTGSTTVEEGALSLGIENAIATSSDVIVEDGATLALNNYNQILNNLSGAGDVTLGSAELTANNTADSEFSGSISGTGSLDKTGTGTLTLSGENTYSGGTTVSDGTLAATNGSALGSGGVAIDTNGTLDLAIASGNETFANDLSGSGTLEKTGSGTATLTGDSVMTGDVLVSEGTLAIESHGAFAANDWTTVNNAETSIGADSSLELAGMLSQENGSTLNVEVGNIEPIITAVAAQLAGTLNVAGFTVSNVVKASDLAGTRYTIIETTTGTISGSFDQVNFGSTTSPADYLIVDGGLSNDLKTYSIGLSLTWYAGATNANGVFTLTNANDAFTVDVALDDQAGSGTGWDGTSLTKAGEGTLILAAENGYTGTTTVEGGTLAFGTQDAIADSASVTVEDGARLALNDYDQTFNNLGGEGDVLLGSAAMTVISSTDTGLAGIVSGTGSVNKEGTETFTLSGANTYSGGTEITDGTLVGTVGGAFGTGTVNTASGATVRMALDSDGTFTNTFTGSGAFEKTGSGNAVLTGTGSNVGAVTVAEGKLSLTQQGYFTADSWITENGAETMLGPSSALTVNGNFEQETGSRLGVAIGEYEPIITADAAEIHGALAIMGLARAGDVALASEVLANQYTIIHTENGITGDFDSVDFGGAQSNVDYLLLNGAVSADQKDYNVGFELTWNAGVTLGNGYFTLVDETNIFNVDVLLEDKAASTTGWNGKDLTKEGDGMLILSNTGGNTYSGLTTVNGGILSAESDRAFGNTSSLDIADNAVVMLNDSNQFVGALNTEDGAAIDFGTGSLTITDDQRGSGITDGGTIAGNTLFGMGSLNIDPSIVTVTGANTGYGGDVTLRDGSQLIMNNAAGVGLVGDLTLTTAADTLTLDGTGVTPGSGALAKNIIGIGLVEAVNGADVQLAGDNSAFSGIFDIAAASAMRASAAEHLGTASVTNDGSLYLTANSNWALDNTVTGAGDFHKQGTAQLVVNDALAGATGAGYIEQGALIVGDGATTSSAGFATVDIASGAVLSGTGEVRGAITNEGTIASLNALSGYGSAGTSNLTVGTLANSGTIHLAGTTVGNTLTVLGGMTSTGGTLILNAVFGGDGSQTDKLILDGGATTGTTSMVVRNQGGQGAQTGTGILVVEAINGATTSADAFALSPLSSGYRSTTETLAIGAYDYSLLRGGQGGDAESWYLASEYARTVNPGGGGNGGDIPARPESGAYLGNREAAERMFSLGLHDRLAGYETRVDPITGKKLPGALWARAFGDRTTSYSDNTNLRTRTNTGGVQAGADLYGLDHDRYGSFRFGAMLGAGMARSKTEYKHDSTYSAKGDTDGYMLGLYASWYQDPSRQKGMWVDVWGQHAWFEHEIHGSGLPDESYHARMWSASLEAGYIIPFYESSTVRWTFEPSAQIIYSDYKARDFTEHTGTRIKQSTGDTVATRLGGRVQVDVPVNPDVTLAPFVEGHWWHNSRTGSIFMDYDEVKSNRPRDIAEVRLGVAARIRERLSFTVEANTQQGRDYEGYGGQIGFRYEF